MTNRPHLILAAFSALSLLATVPVRAQQAVTTSIGVHTADLDLRSDAGATALRHRVHSAARAVCGEPGRFGDPESEGYDTCVRAAEEGALIASDRLIASVRTEVRVASAQSVP